MSAVTMVSEYVVEADSTPYELSKKVTAKIKDGWQPFGSVCVTSGEESNATYIIYAQAMVKYK